MKCSNWDCTARNEFGCCMYTACINPKYSVKITYTSNTTIDDNNEYQPEEDNSMNAFTKENLIKLIDKVKSSNTANPYCFYLCGTDIPDSMALSVSEMFYGYEIIDRKNNVYLNGEKTND